MSRAAPSDALRPERPAKANPRTPGQVDRAVLLARHLAAGRLRLPRCRALFSSEGANGAALLRRTAFRVATEEERLRICHRRGTAAFTELWGSEIVLCLPEFREMNQEERAAILLHEVLHHAGVNEQPHDPAALTSVQLTRLVQRKCELNRRGR